MKLSPLTSPLAAAFVALIAGPALAIPIQADFYESLANPSIAPTPRELGATGRVFAPGPELDVADEIANPAEFGGLIEVDFDADGLGFTLTQTGGATDNEFFTLVISNIVFSRSEKLDAVFLDSDDLIDEAALNSSPAVESLSFTSDSILLTISVEKLLGDEYYHFVAGGSAHYSLAVVDTPLPAAAPMLLAGLGGLGFAARRRRARAA